MDQFDKVREQQVWERVLGEHNPDSGSEGSMLYREMEAERAFRRLAAATPAWGDSFRSMARTAHRHADVLLGICRMGDSDCRLTQLPDAEETQSADAALRKSYHRALWLCNAYHKRSDDSEYGDAYAKLHDAQCEQLTRLLEIMGAMRRR